MFSCLLCSLRFVCSLVPVVCFLVLVCLCSARHLCVMMFSCDFRAGETARFFSRSCVFFFSCVSLLLVLAFFVPVSYSQLYSFLLARWFVPVRFCGSCQVPGFIVSPVVFVPVLLSRAFFFFACSSRGRFAAVLVLVFFYNLARGRGDFVFFEYGNVCCGVGRNRKK